MNTVERCTKLCINSFWKIGLRAGPQKNKVASKDKSQTAKDKQHYLCGRATKLFSGRPPLRSNRPTRESGQRLPRLSETFAPKKADTQKAFLFFSSQKARLQRPRCPAPMHPLQSLANTQKPTHSKPYKVCGASSFVVRRCDTIH